MNQQPENNMRSIPELNEHAQELKARCAKLKKEALEIIHALDLINLCLKCAEIRPTIEQEYEPGKRWYFESSITTPTYTFRFFADIEAPGGVTLHMKKAVFDFAVGPGGRAREISELNLFRYHKSIVHFTAAFERISEESLMNNARQEIAQFRQEMSAFTPYEEIEAPA